MANLIIYLGLFCSVYFLIFSFISSKTARVIGLLPIFIISLEVCLFGSGS